MARARKAAAPAPEPEPEVVEEASRKRGPGELADLHVAWIDKVYGVKITAEQLYLAQSTRREFREDPESGYAEYKAEREAAAEAADTEEKPARRARKATAEPATEEAPVETTRTRRRRRDEDEPASEPVAAPAKRTRAKAAAPAASPAAEPAAEEPTPTRRRARKAPF